MKASDSTDYVDPTYVTNRAQAKLQGLKVGAYHFARPDATPGDAVAEADHFIATAALGGGDLVPVLDLETTGGLSVANLQAWVSAFLGRINDRTGDQGDDLHLAQLLDEQDGRHPGLRRGRLQVAVDRALDDEPAATVPAVELGGQRLDVLAVHLRWDVPGILGRVDLDRYNRADFGPVLLK